VFIAKHIKGSSQLKLGMACIIPITLTDIGSEGNRKFLTGSSIKNMKEKKWLIYCNPISRKEMDRLCQTSNTAISTDWHHL
jgi:hypothetical protein